MRVCLISDKHSLFQRRRNRSHNWPQAQGPALPPGLHTRCLLHSRTDWASPSHQTAGAWTPAVNTHKRDDHMWVLFKAKGSILFKLHHLHGGVVHNHAVKRDVWVAWGNFPAALQEQSITKFPVRAKRSLLTFPPSGNSQIRTLF